MNFTIYTKERDGKWESMLSGFNNSHEALTWLISTYQANAEFWKYLEVKVIREN